MTGYRGENPIQIRAIFEDTHYEQVCERPVLAGNFFGQGGVFENTRKGMISLKAVENNKRNAPRTAWLFHPNSRHSDGIIAHEPRGNGRFVITDDSG
jgi:hypothetical protein